MKLRVIVPSVALAGAVPLVYLFMPHSNASEEISATESWHPTHVEIVAAIGKGHGGTYNDRKHLQFARMFQQRYRDRDHAVGVKFLPNGKIKAMFAPLIARWDMAKVAVDARIEAGDVFGEEYPVDIYETYITAPMKKLAEVRPGKNGKLNVQFDPQFAFEPPPVRQEGQRALKPSQSAGTRFTPDGTKIHSTSAGTFVLSN